MPMNEIASTLLQITAILRDDVAKLEFSHPVQYTYNPLTYAWAPHELYIKKYGNSKKKNLFLGMNPGPFGMAQTGVPFGEVNAVMNWLHIHSNYTPPQNTHPKRPILGFNCPRSEVSGRRLWGLFAEHFTDAEHFFEDNYVANYCPLIWMSESGANITPDKLPAEHQNAVDNACMKHLVQLISTLEAHTLIGVGAYATKKLEAAAKQLPNKTFTIGTLLHPSPASPIANKLWPSRPTEQLKELHII